MRRPARHLVMSLLVGVVISILLAWVLALRLGDPHPLVKLAPPAWPAAAPVDWPPPTHAARATGLGIQLDEATAVPDLLPDDASSIQHVRGMAFIRVRATGFPLPCLERIEIDGPGRWESGGEGASPVDMERGLVCPSWLAWLANETDMRLPIRPRMLALTVNVLCWAAACWVMLFLVSRRRLAARRRGGLCPRCRYPVGSFVICSECGEQIIGT